MKAIGFCGVIGWAVIASGCADGKSSEPENGVDQRVFVSSVQHAEPAARPALRLLPDDLSTGVRDTTPVVLVASELGAAQEKALQAALKLVEWPSRRPVGVSVRLERRSPSAGESADRYVLVPETALAPGWYAAAIDVSSLSPALVELVGDSPWAGHIVSRFATHSTTIVSDIAAADDARGTELRVRLSSRVRDGRPGQSLVRVTDAGGAVECVGQNDAALALEEGADEIVLRCPSTASPVVTVDATLRSLDGVELGTAYSGHAVLEAVPNRASRRATLSAALRL